MDMRIIRIAEAMVQAGMLVTTNRLVSHRVLEIELQAIMNGIRDEFAASGSFEVLVSEGAVAIGVAESLKTGDTLQRGERSLTSQDGHGDGLAGWLMAAGIDPADAIEAGRAAPVGLTGNALEPDDIAWGGGNVGIPLDPSLLQFRTENGNRPSLKKWASRVEDAIISGQLMQNMMSQRIKQQDQTIELLSKELNEMRNSVARSVAEHDQQITCLTQEVKGIHKSVAEVDRACQTLNKLDDSTQKRIDELWRKAGAALDAKAGFERHLDERVSACVAALTRIDENLHANGSHIADLELVVMQALANVQELGEILTSDLADQVTSKIWRKAG